MAPLSSLGLAGAGRSYYKICQESSTIPSDSAIGSQGAEDLLDNVGYESFCDSERDADSLFFLRGAPCGAFQPDFRIQRDATALFKGIIGEEALRCGGPRRRSGWCGC